MRTAGIFLLIFLSLSGSGQSARRPKCTCPLRPKDECRKYCDSLINGVYPYNYPRKTYAVGTVFKFTAGSEHPEPIKTLLAAQSLESDLVTLPDTLNNVVLSGSKALRFILLNPSPEAQYSEATVNAHYRLELNKTQALVQKYEAGTIDSLLKHSNIIWKPDTRYFIVRKTISTNSIVYLPDNEKATTELLEKKSEYLTPAKVDGANAIVQKFGTYYGVYYEAMEIFPSGLGISNDKSFGLKKVQAPVITD